MRMTTDDNELAARAGAGDRDAFRALLERHYDTVYRVALRVLANTADAEDVTQEVCCSLPRRLKSFRGASRFTTWLYRVAVNACRDHVRKAGTMRVAHAGHAEVSALLHDERAETGRQIGWMYEALADLSDDLRETAVLVVAEDLSHAEAASILDVKESTISWRMHEVRKKLKTMAVLDQ